MTSLAAAFKPGEKEGEGGWAGGRGLVTSSQHRNRVHGAHRVCTQQAVSAVMYSRHAVCQSRRRSSSVGRLLSPSYAGGPGRQCVLARVYARCPFRGPKHIVTVSRRSCSPHELCRIDAPQAPPPPPLVRPDDMCTTLEPLFSRAKST